MKLSELIKLHILKRLPAVLCTVLVTALFSLYYIGFLDFSFIQRPGAWKDNLLLFTQMKDTGSDPDTEKEPEETEKVPEDTKDTQKEPEDTKPQRPQGGNDTPTLNLPVFKTVAQLKADGYYLTDKTFDSSCVFGKLNMEYPWPKELSYSYKAMDIQEVTKYEDGTESTVETVRKATERMALELYMGYIIYDNDGELFLIGPDGAVLRTYQDNDFIPAYTRDREGRPLFYKNTTFKEKYPTVLGEENEEGERKWEKTAELTIKDKVYYYLAPNGQSFIKSDYNDATDNRGLYFDYPSYYGNTSSRLKRYYLNTTKFLTGLDGKTSVVDAMSWTYSQEKLKLSDYEFDRDGILITEDPVPEGEEPKTKKELFPYTMAYNYSEGYAAVFSDIDWTYDHDMENDGVDEIKTYDVTTNELRVVNEKGDIMFESRKNFFSDLSWTAHEKYSRPLLSDINSLGSYYFDHGLMRMRIQTWDCYYFAQFDTVKIVTDDDVLVRPNGELFTMPTGYRMISYSDGVILFEKDGKYGYMNYLGNWIRDPELLDAKPFIEGLAVCKNAEGNYGVIDTEGNAVIPFYYSYISNISSGTLVAYSDTSGWTVYQKLTK